MLLIYSEVASPGISTFCCCDPTMAPLPVFHASHHPSHHIRFPCQSIILDLPLTRQPFAVTLPFNTTTTTPSQPSRCLPRTPVASPQSQRASPASREARPRPADRLRTRHPTRTHRARTPRLRYVGCSPTDRHLPIDPDNSCYCTCHPSSIITVYSHFVRVWLETH